MFLVVQTAFLGDMVLTTPLISRLAERGAVDVVATPANAPLLRNHPAVRDVIVFDKRSTHRGLQGLREIARQIRYRNVDGIASPRGARQAFMAQGSTRSALAVRLAGVPEIIGFTTSGGRWFYTKRIAFDDSLHHTARLLSLAGLNHVGELSVRPALFPGAAEERAVISFLEESSLIDGGRAANVPRGAPLRLILLAPGSVRPAKRWPHFGSLAARIIQSADDVCVVLIGGKADTRLCDDTRAAALTEAVNGGPTGSEDSQVPDARIVNAAGRLTLLGTAALMRRAQLIVSNDSAPLHLASAMDIPTVAIFGSTVPSLGFGPLATIQATVVRAGKDCLPCDSLGRDKCPPGPWNCIERITVDEVMTGVRALLGNDK